MERNYARIVRRVRIAAGMAAWFAAGCATSHAGAASDQAALAAIPADLRMMGAESTWVARGVGYDLVTRSKPEILPLMAQLDDQSRFYTKLFDADPAKVIAAVRRIGPPGSVPEASAPVPFDVGPVVEMDVVRPLRKGEKIQDEPPGRGGYAGRGRGGAAGEVYGDSPARISTGGPTTRVVRAWLSARATKLSGRPSTPAAANGSVDDPRVPAWAEDAIPGLAVPTGREDTLTARLAMQVDSMYPIHSMLTMSRPGPVASAGRGTIAGRGDPRGNPGGMGGGVGGGEGGMGGGRRGGMGGMGGIGGRMGGMGGSMGRGGGRGYPGADGGRPPGPLQGGALFATQALLFGRYLTIREGPSFVGALVDAQLQSQDVNRVFANAQMVPTDLERVDIEFRRWLIDRAAHPEGRR